jgi:hypothetical protein
MAYPKALRSLFRWLARAAALVLMCVAVGCVAIYASAKLFEHRAERLCGHIKTLRVGGSTFNDIQRLRKEYLGAAISDGEKCAAEDCAFTILLKNKPFPVFYDAPVMWRLGIRPAMAAATLKVSNGKLSYASFGIYMRTQFGYWLEGAFHAAPHLTMYDKCRDIKLGRDSTYAVRNAHLTNGVGGGWSVQTAFGTEATSDQIRKGTEIRFSCITARPGCRATSDLMPEARRDVSLEPNPDRLFTKECQDYVKKVEVGSGPWALDSAFSPDPVSVNYWSLARPTD